MNLRIGYGYDVHRLSNELSLVLGGVTIPHHKGCIAHSDGDVLLHGICDAILGAMALGDIGVHFPDTDTQYKNISSLILLRTVYDIMFKNSYSIVNIDSCITLERPKIMPYVLEMRQNIASVLSVPIDCVSIKATTNETLGFIGREEGITASAIVLLAKK